MSWAVSLRVVNCVWVCYEVISESKSKERHNDETNEVSHSVEHFTSHSKKVWSLREYFQHVYHSDPNKERRGWVEELLELGVGVQDQVVDDDKDYQNQGDDVCITPQDDWVVREILNLKEILIEEIEASQEENNLEHQIEDVKHSCCVSEESWILLLSDWKLLYHDEVSEVVDDKG